MLVFWIVLALFILFIIGWDLYLIFGKNGSSNKSISANLIRLFNKYPSLPFVTGFILAYVFGHLTWSMSDFSWQDKDVLIKQCKDYLKEHDK